jgi:hypothetical protein
MFLLYHSEGCNICEMKFHKCYVNDLRTTTCSGMLGHRSRVVIFDSPGKVHRVGLHVNQNNAQPESLAVASSTC